MQYDASRSTRRAHGAAFFFVLMAQSSWALADYPIASHRYLADPAALVSSGRVYLYSSNDDDNPVEGGYQMKSIVCVSSSDLKNWTDHGEVFRVPANAAWANDSWAPAAVERNGNVYLYFGNNATGVGVVSSTSPSGPFSDPRGSALVDSSTPGAPGTDSWLFDPSVFIDDDGQAYLTFGGNGDDNARIIRLNDDMISVAGSAIALSIPDYFEASWLFKHNGLYYLSYSTTPATGQRIDYLTSSSPTSGFTYRGVVADQPPSNNNNNNHHATFEFNGGWYHAYHNRVVATAAGIPTTYRRNLALERLELSADGTIQQVTYTMDGVPQLGSASPYVRVEAETLNAQSGIETEPCSAGGMNVTDVQAGDWIKVRGVDFGTSGAQGFSASVASAEGGGNIELRLDSSSGTVIGSCTVPSTGGPQSWAVTTCAVAGATGVHDLYLTFAGVAPFNMDYWQFTTGVPDTGAPSGEVPGGEVPSGEAPSGEVPSGEVLGAAGAASVAPVNGSTGVAPAARRDRQGCVIGAPARFSGAAAAFLLVLGMALRARRTTRPPERRKQRFEATR